MLRRDAFSSSSWCVANRPIPLYYLGLVPLVFISAVWFWSRPTARGTAAAAVVLGAVLLVPWPIMALYEVGVRIPTFFQTMAVFWPQLVFFGSTIPQPHGLLFAGLPALR